MKFISRKQALVLGLKTYFTGAPCKHGHVAPRAAVDRGCRECSRLQGKRRYEKSANSMNAYHKARRLAEPEVVRERDRAAYQKAKDSRLAKAASYRASNPGKVKQTAKRWREANRPARAAHQRNRKARLAAGGTHSAADVAQILNLQRNRCAYCRARLNGPYHVDHIIALSRGGSNDRRNLQVLCIPCNQSKHAADPIEFAQRLGRLV
jgi:5-methylcytosine-specific restriction endonuclease McrA